MNEMDLVPNSHKYKKEQAEKAAAERRVEPVVQSVAKTKKKNDLTKLRDVFISEDIENVKSYIWVDIVVPLVKKALFDIVSGGAEMLFYGKSGRSGGRSSADRVSYRQYYERDDHRSEPAARNRYDYDDLIFNTRIDAERVREEMVNVIERYGFVRVADMYDMANLSAPYTSNRYGWTSIRNAEIKHVRDGWIIALPKAMPID